MRRVLYPITFFVGLGIGLIPFTNCDSYTESSAFQELNSVDQEQTDCSDGVCTSSSIDSLELRTYLNSLTLNGITDVTLGGDCNDGGFYDNVVKWKVMLNQAIVSDAGGQLTSDRCGGAGSFCQRAVCVDGQFTARIRVPSVNATYEVRFEIVGIDDQGDVYPAGSAGRSLVTIDKR